MQINQPRLLAIGSATPPSKYTQTEVLDLLGTKDEKMRRIFKSSHIQSRHLCLPLPDETGNVPEESPEELLGKHRRIALDIGQQAIGKALKKAGLTPEDIDYFTVVSTTGLLCPGLTAHFIKALKMRPDIHRVDTVGMGCNAGLNGMQPVVNFCALNPEAVGLLLCVEVCSAMYVNDDTINTAVVNSLFGDGASAVVISAKPFDHVPVGPKIVGFSSHIIPDAIDAMRLDLRKDKHAFYLDKQIPYVLGLHVGTPVDRLLKRFNRKRRQVAHWVVHSGGRKVIDAIKYSLNITDHDVRHTISVLRDYGNVSSGSFLFSGERLLDEGVSREGDLIMMMTMGPGSTIECCLGEF